MGFPYFELLVVNATGDNECPCCGELDRGPHVYEWDLHKIEKSDWFKRLESIGGNRVRWDINEEDSNLINRMIDEATEEQEAEMHLWHGSESEISDGAIGLFFDNHDQNYDTRFKEGFTVLLMNAVYHRDYWGEWDCWTEVIKEAHIGGLDIEQEKLDNWKSILERIEEDKKNELYP